MMPTKQIAYCQLSNQHCWILRSSLGIRNLSIKLIVQMADAELDRMWNEGTQNEERIENFRHLHERTPYNKPIL